MILARILIASVGSIVFDTLGVDGFRCEEFEEYSSTQTMGVHRGCRSAEDDRVLDVENQPEVRIVEVLRVKA